ncbi:MAG: hypothetical protein LBT46_04180 [Planctomycetaceae bacterium]|jgi:hypothetical protein|nr:hypothetical protein [Planctomycetaceae bacterium]
MSAEPLYAVCVRKLASTGWCLLVKDGQPLPVTIRQFVESERAGWLRGGEILVQITHKQLCASLHENPDNDKYVKMLGWNYSAAVRIAEQDGAVLLFTTHPWHPARPYSPNRFNCDDDYALEVIRDIYASRGGLVVVEEFDAAKHIRGYVPQF